MEKQQEKSTVGKCSVFWLVIFSGLTAAAAIILVVMLASWGNTGFVGSGSIAPGTCSGYFGTKFGTLPRINSVIFVCSCVAALTSGILLLVFIAWVCKTCCDSLKPSVTSKGALFFLLALTILASIPPVGYYLTFIFELGQCTNVVIDVTNTLATLFMAGGITIFAFIVLMLVLCQDYVPSDSEDKYRHVHSSQTEPNEYARERERNVMRDSIREDRRSPMIVKEEITKQNIHVSREIAYDSPQKRREDPKIYLQPKRSVESRNQFRPQPTQERGPNRSPFYREEILTQNLHPALRNADPRRRQPEEERSFQREARKYYDDDRRGILSRQEGYEERDRRDRDRYSPQRGYRYREEMRTPERRGGYSPSREERGGIMRNYANYRN